MHSPSSRGGNKLCFFLSANSEIDTIANKEIVRNYSTYFNILNSTEYGFFLFSICTNNFYDLLVLKQYNRHSKGFFLTFLLATGLYFTVAWQHPIYSQLLERPSCQNGGCTHAQTLETDVTKLSLQLVKMSLEMAHLHHILFI